MLALSLKIYSISGLIGQDDRVRRAEEMYTMMTNKKKGVTFDIASGIVQYRANDNSVIQSKLGKKEREVLVFLVKNIGRIVSKEDILQNVWTNRIVCENTASVALSNIRKLLRKADNDCACLVSVSGSGYIFNPAKSGFSLINGKDGRLSFI